MSLIIVGTATFGSPRQFISVFEKPWFACRRYGLCSVGITLELIITTRNYYSFGNNMEERRRRDVKDGYK